MIPVRAVVPGWDLTMHRFATTDADPEASAPDKPAMEEAWLTTVVGRCDRCRQERPLVRYRLFEVHFIDYWADGDLSLCRIDPESGTCSLCWGPVQPLLCPRCFDRRSCTEREQLRAALIDTFDEDLLGRLE